MTLVLFVAAATAMSSVVIEPKFEVLDVNVSKNATDVPIDFHPTVAFDAHGGGEGTVTLFGPDGAEIASDSLELERGPALLTLDPGADLLPDTDYVLVVTGDEREDGTIPFRTGAGRAPEFDAARILEEEGADLTWYEDALHGHLALEVEPANAAGVMVMIVDEAGVAGAAQRLAGGDDDYVGFTLELPSEPPDGEACLRPVWVDLAGRVSEGEDTCIVATRDIASCSSTPMGAATALGVVLAGLASLRRRR